MPAHSIYIRSVILTNTFPRCNVSFRRIIEILRDACDQLDSYTFGRLGQWIIYSADFQNTNEEFMLDAEANDADACMPMPTYAYKAQCNGILGHDASSGLSSIKAPTLVVGGDADLFVPVSVTMEMFNAIPNAELYMCKNGGHVQHWEQLEEYNRITSDFLLRHRTEIQSKTEK